MKEARDTCRKLREAINLGIDPKEEHLRQHKAREEEEQTQNNQGTLEQLFDFYIQDLLLDGKASVKEVERIYFKDIHPLIGDLKTKDVTKKDCALVVKMVVDRGSDVMANRLRSYMHAAFNFGIYAEDEPRWIGKVPEFGLLHNPVAQTRRHLKNERVGERALSKAEIRLLWQRLSSSVMKPQFILALKLLFSTGLRVRQVLDATWDEFDLNEMVWEIPDSRNRKGSSQAKKHTVALTEFHINLLNGIRELSPTGFLFPNQTKDAPIEYKLLSKAVTRFCKPNSYYEGFEYFTPKDARRTWKTLAGSIGLGLELRNRIQGHALSDVGSKHYDRYSYLDEKRLGMERYTTWLTAVINDEENNVIPMIRTGS